MIRLINNSSAVSTFSISQSGTADALDESVFSPSLPGKSRLGECPCEVTVAGNSSATFGLRVVVGDVTPGWYTSRVRVHRLHTGGRLLASFQIKIDEVGADWDVAVSRGSVSVAEADDLGTVGVWEHQAAYSVRLTEEPSGVVTVTPVSADASVVAVSGALTFTAANWQAPQTVTVTAVDDDIDNVGDRHASIRHDVSGIGSGEVMVDDVAVVVADDDTRGVSVSAGSLALAEADDPDTGGVLEHRGAYTVRLASEPAGGDVTVDLASGDTSVATVSPATLTFTSADWSTEQTVTVTAVDDSTDTAGGRQTSIAHTVASAGDYAGVSADSVSVTVGPPRSGPCPAAAGGDYDIDDDGLIEICNLAQLNAIRWDLNGDGAADVYPPDKNGFTGHDPDGAAKLAAAFPNAATGMGCPTGGCTGFELSADLDFDTNGNGRADTGDTYWNNGLGWHPLIGAEKIKSTKAHYRFRDHFVVGRISVCCGDRPNPRARMFTAEFEGNGRTIANLYINDPKLSWAGLFGAIGPGAHVRNFGLTAPNADSQVIGSWSVGALTGEIERARVSGVYSDLDVSGNAWVGGLAGSIWRYGFMIESYATGDVAGGAMVGGLLGSVSWTGVAAVYATGDVTVAGDEGGGLVGYRTDGHIRAAYATGSVTHTGAYSGPHQRRIGGLVGHYSHSWTESWMRANYATGRVSSPSAEVAAGGLTAGCTRSKRERSDGANYWDIEATGMVHSPDCGLGFTTAQLQAPTGYTGIYEDWDVDVDVGSYHGSFLGPGDDPWDFGTSTQYPVLKYCAEKPGIETPDGQPYCPLRPDNQRGPSSGQVGTVSNPVVNVAAATNIREGETAAFVIAANPSPSADLPVNISVTASGDYGVTVETKTVTVPAGGSYTLGVATADDNVGEDDGTVTVTINTGTGYTVSETSGAASVTVHDDDEPKISITAGADVAEGGVAEFALTAVPAPASPLSVNVSVAQSGDFGVSTGSRQVTVPTSGAATLSVATVNDSADEADGSVTATVGAGSGYAVSATAGTVTVAVADDDDPPCDTADAISRARSAFAWHSDNNGGSETLFWQILAYLGADPLPAPPGGAVPGSTTPEAVRTFSEGKSWPGWTPINAAMSCHTPPPEVSITAGADVDEGGDAVFTVTADPAPSVALDVTVAVAQSGDFGVSPGSRTVTIPITGSADLTVATTNDSADEVDGSVTATVSVGSGYRVSAAAGTATVAVRDDDVPEVSIAAGAGIVEGGDAVFTVTAVPAPSAGLDVAVAVTAAGDFGVAAGSRTVTVPTSGSATLTVATTNDSTDEADGSVTATVSAGSGYTVSSAASSASVAVADDDVAAPVGDPCVVALSGDGSVTGEWAVGCDSSARAGRYARFYSFSLGGSALVTIDLESSADTYLYLRAGPGQRSGAALVFNDDGGDGYNSRISRRLAAGDYTIEATTYRSSTAGSFTLTVAGIPTQTAVQPDPEVSIAAGGDVDEGGDATFTVTAVPAPSAGLDVTVAVTAAGDFGVSPGSHTVTVPTSGSVTLTVATTNDSADEADGSVTATVTAGSGYTVSATAGAATVAVRDDDDPAPPPPLAATPEVSIAAGADIDEGGDAIFTVTADPAPSALLTVDVTVAQSGDFGVTAGARQVTIPTTGSVTLTVATANDSADEADGSVTVTVGAGSGYTVSASAAAATVAVRDDDDPAPPPPADPEVSITAGSGITEGGDAVFTITADPAPAAPLTVDVAVAQSGDFGVSPGTQTVTIPTSGTATLTVATTNDTTDEPDGSVTATVSAGSGYTVSTAAGTATIAIADDDNPPPPPPPPPPASKPTITVDDATAAEGDGAIEFTVRLSATSTATVTVYYAANPGTAMPYADYRPDWGQITFAPGDTTKTIQVSLIDDRTPREGDETLTLKLILTDTAHATLADNQAQGTITDND